MPRTNCPSSALAAGSRRGTERSVMVDVRVLTVISTRAVNSPRGAVAVMAWCWRSGVVEGRGVMVEVKVRGEKTWRKGRAVGAGRGRGWCDVGGGKSGEVVGGRAVGLEKGRKERGSRSQASGEGGGGAAEGGRTWRVRREMMAWLFGGGGGAVLERWDWRRRSFSVPARRRSASRVATSARRASRCFFLGASSSRGSRPRSSAVVSVGGGSA